LYCVFRAALHPEEKDDLSLVKSSPAILSLWAFVVYPEKKNFSVTGKKARSADLILLFLNKSFLKLKPSQ
jgi:hypothetical protein